MHRKETGKEALHSQLKADKALGILGRQGSFERNGVVAQNVLHGDLGYFAEEPPEYGGDPDLICRLAAHARQDAAHALINTKAIMDDQRRLKFRLWVLMALVLLALFAK